MKLDTVRVHSQSQYKTNKCLRDIENIATSYKINCKHQSTDPKFQITKCKLLNEIEWLCEQLPPKILQQFMFTILSRTNMYYKCKYGILLILFTVSTSISLIQIRGSLLWRYELSVMYALFVNRRVKNKGISA